MCAEQCRKMYSVLVLLLLCFCSLHCWALNGPEKAKFQSSNRSVNYEVFHGEGQPAIIILLHGASGPDVPFYRSQAAFFAKNGYTVLLLHYFDATGSSTPSTQNYEVWVKAVQDLIGECARLPHYANRPIALVGYSLGASVALAAGSQGVPVRAIADWYGDLPDAFFSKFRGMPPLLILHGARDSNIPVRNAEQLIRLCEMKELSCESHIYDDQEHGFNGQALEDAEQRTLLFLARVMKPS